MYLNTLFTLLEFIVLVLAKNEGSHLIEDISKNDIYGFDCSKPNLITSHAYGETDECKDANGDKETVEGQNIFKSCKNIKKSKRKDMSVQCLKSPKINSVARSIIH